MNYSGLKEISLNKYFYPTDERMVVISGKIAIVFLVFTQMALLGSILYRRFGLHQSKADYADLQIILLISVFGYIAARLYFGAVLPKSVSYTHLTLPTILLV